MATFVAENGRYRGSHGSKGARLSLVQREQAINRSHKAHGCSNSEEHEHFSPRVYAPPAEELNQLVRKSRGYSKENQTEPPSSDFHLRIRHNDSPSSTA